MTIQTTSQYGIYILPIPDKYEKGTFLKTVSEGTLTRVASRQDAQWVVIEPGQSKVAWIGPYMG